MKILVVASYNKGRFAPFIVEQGAALQAAGCKVEWFGVTGHGIRGYLHQLAALRRKIVEVQPDIIHAHYGLSGLLACLQRRVPVVTTYHGSDINNPHVRPFSCLAMCLSVRNIFVSRATMLLAHPAASKALLLPCGIDVCAMPLTSQDLARSQMGLRLDKRYVLFAGAFGNHVKNAPLAEDAMSVLKEGGADAELLELKGYSRNEVSLLMCAADVLLLTSFTEGSPQVVKEAMTCGCPVVSVDVGDVRERTAGVEGCYVAETREPQELAALLCKALAFSGRTQGREKILADGLDNRQVAQRLIELYTQILAKDK